MNNKGLEISLNNQLSELESLNRYIDDLAEQLELPVAIVMNLNLVLEEIITNIINYAYEDNHEHKITINATKQNAVLKVRIEDDGKAFNMMAYPEPETNLSAEKRNIGGLGIHFVKKLMDEVEYEYTDNKNILVLKKRLDS